ncbi:hypothetical protein VaNZ11_014786 [Volvox africanus]|uniref:Uncharacterized protein n=1 Tax=Volvox africanus TaxID=51714 RepID=A0ABQ5SL23_9CHLO|nr:hypothetical protein VaNZ11_014786 [Volvox africanus]
MYPLPPFLCWFTKVYWSGDPSAAGFALPVRPHRCPPISSPALPSPPPLPAASAGVTIVGASPASFSRSSDGEQCSHLRRSSEAKVGQPFVTQRGAVDIACTLQLGGIRAMAVQGDPDGHT